MFYAIDWYVDVDTGYPYAYILYEPQGSRRPRSYRKRPDAQFVADVEHEDMAAWCVARDIGPFDNDWIETEISPLLAFELKTRWHDLDLTVNMNEA
ncbi:hypothetical protein ACFZ8E_07375 [Methylobacterium sp. HMF5984]|uniref:hypothetical protein n=1 Tax=Methylobacterium sp. HMF5984 TaxID=3367370 RepID=UPI0038548702